MTSETRPTIPGKRGETAPLLRTALSALLSQRSKHGIDQGETQPCDQASRVPMPARVQASDLR
jgi:hypothetical protein